MKRLAIVGIALLALASVPLSSQASPESDLEAFQAFYLKRFPNVPIDEFKNGVYAIDSNARTAWESLEASPPYEDQLLAGEKRFNKKFANGKRYADCFNNRGIGIRQHYPYFDRATGEIKTLEMEINECRQRNGEKPLDLTKGNLAAISAYMASTSNGMELAITIPDDPRARAWYEKGKRIFYQRRGQLNLSCANCHMDNAGFRIHSERLSPALGHPAHFPAYRTKWGELGTLHRRYIECNEQIRAKPFTPQSPEYRALEYFQTYMSNGIKVMTPSSRR